jgi:cytochrome o ubiquinol oxidase subunit 2
MKTRGKILAVAALLLAVVVLAGVYLHRYPIAVLQPAGQIGHKERNLIIFTASVSLVVVVPVFILLGLFAWRYREGNPRGRYDPKLEGSSKLETVWWLLPGLIITLIAVVTWRSSYALDPFKPLQGRKPLHIQVVAMDWKWLFIYPDQNVARVNAVDIPVGTPVEFDITSDAVMTSFWVPQLGGQMYAMPGMTTQLNLEASKAGDYHGVAANISGKGFADMTFTVHAMPPEIYDDWLQNMHRVPQHLTDLTYNQLAIPGTLTPADLGIGKQYTYSSVQPGLYDTIVMKYMMPTDGSDSVDTAGVSF